MQRGRFLQIYRLHLRGIGRRLFHDLAREVVIFMSAAILVALFFFIFNDFINSQVHAISHVMQEAFSKVLGWVMIATGGLLGGKAIQKQLQSGQNWAQAAAFLGESQPSLRLFRILELLTTALGWNLPVWWLVSKIFFPFSVSMIIVGGCIMGLMALVSSSKQESSASEGTVAGVFPEGVLSPRRAMAHWRMVMMWRSRIPRICLIASSTFLGIAALLALRGAPELALVLLCFCAGLFSAFAVVIQISDEVRSMLWTQLQHGMTENDFWAISTFQSAVIAICTAMGALPCSFAIGLGAFKLAAVASTPTLLVVAVILQIDAQRPLIPILSVILAALFVGTAVFAWPWAIFAMPVLMRAGIDSQRYRLFRI